MLHIKLTCFCWCIYLLWGRNSWIRKKRKRKKEMHGRVHGSCEKDWWFVKKTRKSIGEMVSNVVSFFLYLFLCPLLVTLNTPFQPPSMWLHMSHCHFIFSIIHMHSSTIILSLFKNLLISTFTFLTIYYIYSKTIQNISITIFFKIHFYNFFI